MAKGLDTTRHARSYTYHCAGVRGLVTTNARDYQIFGCFVIVQP